MILVESDILYSRHKDWDHTEFAPKIDQTVDKESGVLDDSIRQPAHGLKNCLQQKMNFGAQCASIETTCSPVMVRSHFGSSS